MRVCRSRPLHYGWGEVGARWAVAMRVGRRWVRGGPSGPPRGKPRGYMWQNVGAQWAATRVVVAEGGRAVGRAMRVGARWWGGVGK